MAITAPERPIRILQIVGRMSMGGISTTLMHILRNLDLARYQIEFLYIEPEGGSPYDEELKKMGINIFHCPRWKIWSFGRKYKQFLREHGPYDVVHANFHRFNGYLLKIAQAAKVPICISHSHFETARSHNPIIQAYEKLQKHWIKQHSTIKLAVSGDAAESLFGKDWQNDPKVSILHSCRDFSDFESAVDKESVRKEFGIPADAMVIGHVGCLLPEKNHSFILEIAALVAQQQPNMRLLLVGVGPLQSKIKAKINKLGIADKVIFAGLRHDVPRLMLGAMDVFLFPSIEEGLAMVVLEAQAAGVPCVYADTIPTDIDLAKPLLTRMNLSQSAEEWAAAVLSAYNCEAQIDQKAVIAAINETDFGWRLHINELTEKYWKI